MNQSFPSKEQLTSYEQWQMDKYGDILPVEVFGGSDEEEPEEHRDAAYSHFATQLNDCF